MLNEAIYNQQMKEMKQLHSVARQQERLDTISSHKRVNTQSNLMSYKSEQTEADQEYRLANEHSVSIQVEDNQISMNESIEQPRLNLPKLVLDNVAIELDSTASQEVQDKL